jgi:hypothetical protein
MAICGGIQNCIGDEEQAFNAAGFCYVHIRPEQALPGLAPEVVDPLNVGLTVDGQFVGFFDFRDLGPALATVGDSRMRMLVIHHLNGFPPERVIELAEKVEFNECLFWLHDFASVCPSHTLMRNDIAFCHAPPPGSPACNVCVYGEERRGHVARMEKLFDALNPSLLAPSKSALAFWKARSTLTHRGSAVAAHGTMKLGKTRQRTERKEEIYPLRVAFLGTPAFHKGWHAFESLAVRHWNDPRYEFFFFGSDLPSTARNINHVAVRVRKDHRSAMIEAMRECGVDVAIIWSLWPETFCFTAHEAMAAGAFVVTVASSGNVADLVRDEGITQGCVLESEADLLKNFESGAFFSLVGKAREGDFIAAVGSARYLLRSQT